MNRASPSYSGRLQVLSPSYHEIFLVQQSHATIQQPYDANVSYSLESMISESMLQWNGLAITKSCYYASILYASSSYP